MLLSEGQKKKFSPQLKQRLAWHFADSVSVEPSCIFLNMVACASCLGGAQFYLKIKHSWEKKFFTGNTIMPEMAKTKQQLISLRLARVKAKLFCYGWSLVGGIGG